jgi:transcriptional regulator with XRE-family HTH domain
MPRRGVPGFSAARAREALEVAKLSPADRARAARIAPSDVSKYLNGQAAPQPGRFVALARALDSDPARLLDDGTDDQLARLRVTAGLTQAELCQLTGVGTKHYEAAEAGRRRLTPDDIVRLAAALNVSGGLIQSAHDRDVASRAEALSAEDHLAGA